jgi:predicted Zn-dependent protease
MMKATDAAHGAIEDGILRATWTASTPRSGRGPGNGRRESFASLPIPVDHTIMPPATHDPDEILASVKDGLAVNFGGGQVDITSGEGVLRRRRKIGQRRYPVRARRSLATVPMHYQVSMVSRDPRWTPASALAAKTGERASRRRPADNRDWTTVGGTG